VVAVVVVVVVANVAVLVVIISQRALALRLNLAANNACLNKGCVKPQPL
jgi:hypothetical protein